MRIDISSLSKSELIELHRLVVDRIRYLSEQEKLDHLSKFKIGDAVYIQNGTSLSGGIVIKINSKTLTIYLTTGETWRVSPSIVKKANSLNKELLKLKEDFFKPMNLLLRTPEINNFSQKQWRKS
ncbi:MAG: hypothetical protein Q8Q56_02125 [Alphaproteobacteria bacterium]|nr:hypothetical protein [Alphaproteobacteria bacterium]